MNPRLRCVLQARIGVALWAAGVWWMKPEWHVALFLLAPLSIVPLGLALLRDRGDAPMGPFWTAASWLQLPAAAMLLVAHALREPGAAPALIALPWLGVTGLLALFGLQRLQARRLRGEALRLEELSLDAGLLFVVVGGVWEVATLYGQGLMGFEGVIVQLTAIHFHFAGFALPLLAGALGRAPGGPGRMGRLAAAGVMLGVPLTAIGITAAPALEWLAAWVLSASGFTVGGGQLWLAATDGRAPRTARIFLGLSGLAILGGMGLAAAWSLSNYLQQPILSIANMIPTHGALNALGFSFLGLWSRALYTPLPRS